MGDTVNTNVIFSGNKRYVAKFTNISDGTGESAVAKVDKSELIGLTGAAPDSLVIEEAEWNVQGFSYVLIAWAHDTDDEAMVLSGSGYKDYRASGGIKDPESTGGTGDIVFTTAGGASGSSYDISLALRLKG